MIKNRSFIL